MAIFLIDVNLPYRFGLWTGLKYIHVKELGETWTDSQIWRYAPEQNLTIVSKDADFSERMLLHDPPPRVIDSLPSSTWLRRCRQAQLGESGPSAKQSLYSLPSSTWLRWCRQAQLGESGPSAKQSLAGRHYKAEIGSELSRDSQEDTPKQRFAAS